MSVSQHLKIYQENPNPKTINLQHHRRTRSDRNNSIEPSQDHNSVQRTCQMTCKKIQHMFSADIAFQQQILVLPILQLTTTISFLEFHHTVSPTRFLSFLAVAGVSLNTYRMLFFRRSSICPLPPILFDPLLGRSARPE